MAGGDFALAALSGLMKGAAGFPQGLETGQTQALKEAELGELQQHRRTLENQAYLDLPPEMATTFGLSSPRIRKELAPLYTTMYEKQAARDLEAQRNRDLTQALIGSATTTAAQPPEGAMYSEVGPKTITDPGLMQLAKLVPGMGHEKMGPLVTEYMKEQAPKLTPHITQTETGPAVIVTDKSGNLVRTTPTGLEPMQRNPWTAENIKKRLALEHTTPSSPFYGKLPEGSLAYQRAYDDLARQVPVAPGGAAYGGGALLNPEAILGSPGPAAAPRPAIPSVARPIIPTAPETQSAADAQTWVRQARDVAGKLEDYLTSLSPEQRASFAVRVRMQGLPVIGALPGITSKKEQEITSAIGNLQLAWERASGGLRMAASPMMQDRIRQIFGNPTNAATPQHLRTIAGQMEQEIQQRAVTEAQGGRPVIATPPGGMPAPTPAGETLSRRDPRYQKARQRGLSDQQIQGQFGLTLVD